MVWRGIRKISWLKRHPHSLLLIGEQHGAKMTFDMFKKRFNYFVHRFNTTLHLYESLGTYRYNSRKIHSPIITVPYLIPKAKRLVCGDLVTICEIAGSYRAPDYERRCVDYRTNFIIDEWLMKLPYDSSDTELYYKLSRLQRRKIERELCKVGRLFDLPRRLLLEKLGTTNNCDAHVRLCRVYFLLDIFEESFYLFQHKASQKTFENVPNLLRKWIEDFKNYSKQIFFMSTNLSSTVQKFLAKHYPANHTNIDELIDYNFIKRQLNKNPGIDGYSIAFFKGVNLIEMFVDAAIETAGGLNKIVFTGGVDHVRRLEKHLTENNFLTCTVASDE